MLAPMRRTFLATVLAAALVTAAGGCSRDDTGGAGRPETRSAASSGAAPSAAGTPLVELATDTIAIARQRFCSRLTPEEVEGALGAAAASSEEWANGERVRLAPGVLDVAHEYGCGWTAADRTAVRAWVFAPPVTPGRAAVLRRTAARSSGCRPVEDAPRFGTRSVAVICRTRGGLVGAFHGLFGDAWLSCSVGGPGGAAPLDRAALLDRAGRWCAAVVVAASV
jgi:hypothetical protein